MKTCKRLNNNYLKQSLLKKKAIALNINTINKTPYFIKF